MGLGLGGFLDGIVLHQILQWHHMLTDTGDPHDDRGGTRSEHARGRVFSTGRRTCTARAKLAGVRRQDSTVEVDRSRLFNRDQSEIRGKLRANLIAPNPTAIVKLTAG